LSLEGAHIPVEEGKVADAGGLVCAAKRAGEPFTTLVVDGKCGWQAAAQLLAEARDAAAGAAVQSIVVLDIASKAEFAAFRTAGFDAYLVRPVRPHSVLRHVGALAPGDDAACEGSAPRRDTAQRARATTPVVLLVEDNDINALLARRMLEKTGCDTRQCLNGREAVEAIQRVLAGTDAPHDLILMDIHMPVMDGLEATRFINELYTSRPDQKRPPIVALTANAFEEDRRRCLAAGMDDYLAKPFDRDDLLRLLDRWCGDGGSTRAA
jgi:CheY-like chemotaxis protein